MNLIIVITTTCLLSLHLSMFAMLYTGNTSPWYRRTREQICVDEYGYRKGIAAGDATKHLHACLEKVRQYEEDVRKGYASNQPIGN